MRRLRIAGAFLLLELMLVATAQPAAAQSVSQFYGERTITLLVASAPGGVNDLVGRLIAKLLGRFIPGNPAIIVQNLRAELKDGSAIAMLQRAPLWGIIMTMKLTLLLATAIAALAAAGTANAVGLKISRADCGR